MKYKKSFSLIFPAAKVSGSESEEMEIESRPSVGREARDHGESETPHTPGLSLVGTGLSGSMNSATGTGTAAARIIGDHSHTGSQVVITLTKDDSKVVTKGMDLFIIVLYLI